MRSPRYALEIGGAMGPADIADIDDHARQGVRGALRPTQGFAERRRDGGRLELAFAVAPWVGIAFSVRGRV